MNRAIHIVVILCFLGSTIFILPRCLLVWPSAIPSLEGKDKLVKGARHSPKPCCAKKNDAAQTPKHPVSCSLLFSKFQPQATTSLLRTVPDLQPSIQSLDSFRLISVYHSRVVWGGEPPGNPRSRPIILQKQSFLI